MAAAEAEPPPLCRAIRKAREGLGISQEEAARRLHLSLKGYTAYERFREPKPARAREIARAFGLDENYFTTAASVDEQDEGVASLRSELAALRVDVDEILRLLRQRPPGGARRRSA